MRVQVAATLLCMLVVVVSSQRQQQQNPGRSAQRVPPTILKLRQPLTEIPLKTLFTNMLNQNTVTFYTNCVTGEATCDRVGNALRVLLNDIKPGQDLCYGCTECQREKVQYVLDTMKDKYPTHACKVQKALGRTGIFAGGNPC